MDRRDFNAGLGFTSLAAALIPGLARGATPVPTMLYSTNGADLEHSAVNIAPGEVIPRDAATLPSVIQYADVHPTGRFIYAVTSDAPGGSVGMGKLHRLCALKVGPDGALSAHGEAASLPQRPIHTCVDGSGRFALVAYNAPALVTVHRIAPDGTLGAPVPQAEGLDFGIFPHQVRVMPGNRSVVVVTRGNDGHPAEGNRPAKAEDPGALKLFHFTDGRLSPLTSIAVDGPHPGETGGLGYGPRHLDFHPHLPLAYVALERQNRLHTHRVTGETLSPKPLWSRDTTGPEPGGKTMAGAIHVHPQGHTVYVANRASSTVPYKDASGKEQRVFAGGENSIAVFALNPRTGEPRLVQRIDPRGYYVRDFAIDPSGHLLVAGSLADIWVREDTGLRFVPAGLSVFAIAPDGQLTFLRKYDMPTADQQLMWVHMMQV